MRLLSTKLHGTANFIINYERTDGVATQLNVQRDAKLTDMENHARMARAGLVLMGVESVEEHRLFTHSNEGGTQYWVYLDAEEVAKVVEGESLDETIERLFPTKPDETPVT